MLTAVVPVLVGPLQTLLALLPAILMALGSFLFALFTPRGFKRAVRFLWHQKLLTACLGLAVVSYVTGYPFRHWQATGSADARSSDLSDVGNWPAFRGNSSRTGVDAEGLAASGESNEPTANRRYWDYADEPTVFSSPAIVGRQVIFATAGGIGPFSPAGRGAIVSVDATTGEELWKYAPDGFRATFSSPVVGEGRVVCGEGLHLVQDARVTCLDLGGHLVWEFTTKSHVEATPAIADGRVFVGAGGDGFYCLALHDPQEGAPRVLWHLPASEFPDCESPPVVADGVVYFGLGEGGQAICAVSVADGEVLWRIPTPHPVFAPPTFVDISTSTSQPKADASTVDRSVAGRSRKLIVPMGRGNFIQSAAELLEARLEQLKADGASDADLERARQAGRPEGEVWCIDVGTRRVEWRHKLPETVLGAASCVGDELYFGARDGRVYCLGLDGKPRRSWNAREPIVASVAAGRELVYAVTVTGHLHALRRTNFEPL
ncbi:MAG TPA: PQQ-binding-like beta-propeller repeat protein, partial [Pirellulaceae bacterium]|nr:PQQ-binding-like beta-propeller repeat protein [Pirellulaceae bacterium]